MVTLETLRTYRILPRPAVLETGAFAFRALRRLTGSTTVVAGFSPPTSPVLFATNSTQRNDFLPFRVMLHRAGVQAVSITKARSLNERVGGLLLPSLGVAPLVSRGYLLTADFVATVGRRPTQDEYRALRDHLDHDAPLPKTRELEALASTPRDVLGRTFDPFRESWRDALRSLYAEMMGETLRLLREAVAAGHSVHMYPEGTVSERLGDGRIGAVQLARALDLPIVPVGMNGCRAAFRGDSVIPTGAPIELRFGDAYRPALRVPPTFRPFHPDDEARFRPQLGAATDELMSRLELLLDPALRRDPAAPPKRASGDTRRFL